MADITEEKKTEPVKENAKEEQENNTDTSKEEPVETQTPKAEPTAKEEQGWVSDIVSKDLDWIEKYIDNLTNKEDIKLFVDLVDKWLPASKAYDTVSKIVEKEWAVAKDKWTVETPKAPKTIKEIVSKYL